MSEHRIDTPPTQPGHIDIERIFRSENRLEPPSSYPPGGFTHLMWWTLGLSMAGLPLSLIYVGFLIVLVAFIIWCVLLYRMWRQIADGYQRTTPGLAVGLQFVPFWNYYWIFVVNWGLAKDTNGYLRRHNIQASRVSEGLALTACILYLIGLLTSWLLVGLLPLFIGFICWLILVGQLGSAHRAIAEARLAVPQPVPDS